MTAREFFEQAVRAQLVAGAALRELGGVVEFDISGDHGGTWVVNLDDGVIDDKSKKPQCIVRAREGDFMALVEGRMSVSDGLLTERLHVAGEAGRLTQLLKTLGTLNRA